MRKKLRRERSKREALLTEGEKAIIRSGLLNEAASGRSGQKARSKLYGKLDRRFHALVDDLNLILAAPSLGLWRDVKRNTYQKDLWQVREHLEALLMGGGFRTIYPERIMVKTKGDGEHLLWLKRYQHYSDRIYDPGNLTASLRRAKFKQELITDLAEAHRYRLIPEEEGRAESVREILAQLYGIRARQPRPEAEPEYQEYVQPYKEGIRKLEIECSKLVTNYHRAYSDRLKELGVSLDELLARYEKKRPSINNS